MDIASWFSFIALWLNKQNKTLITRPVGLYLIYKHSALGRRAYKSDTARLGVL